VQRWEGKEALTRLKRKKRAALHRGALLLATAALATAAAPASAELVQKGQIRVSVAGKLSPTTLPRHGASPIEVSIGGHIAPTSRSAPPPQLKDVTFAFNRAGRLDLRGLPRCRLGHIDPSTSQEALLACRSSVVGEGHFSANVRFPEQSPFPSDGKVLAFNGVLRGKPVIFAHVYGTKPVPTSYVLPLEIEHGKGRFSTVMHASLPEATGNWGFVTGLTLTLGRTWQAHGVRHSFLSAGCPAPAGFPGVLFPLTRTSFSFVGGKTLTATINRSCTARG
jgi:hypothetical protein